LHDVTRHQPIEHVTDRSQAKLHRRHRIDSIGGALLSLDNVPPSFVEFSRSLVLGLKLQLAFKITPTA
jgi:hypothetical protein